VNRLKAGVTVAAKVICCRKFFQGRTMLFERNQLLGIIVWCVSKSFCTVAMSENVEVKKVDKNDHF
jgi:hypothetical protein